MAVMCNNQTQPSLLVNVIYLHRLTVVFHSTALRGSQFEVQVQVPFLKAGAFIAQSIAAYPSVRAIRKMGDLNGMQLAAVESAVFKWLGRIA